MTTTVALPDTILDRIADDRSIAYRWARPDVEVPDKMNDPGVRYVELYVYHSKHSKEYVAMLHIIDVFPGWIQSHISPRHGIAILKRPTARHSAKALQQFANESMQRMIDAMDDSRVATLFSGQPLPDPYAS
jgi:hypothetical protein